MSENARRKSDGQNVKIGTCESMYYLRFDQRDQVDYPWPALSDDPETLDPFLYRFPDPREDGTDVGEYESGWGGVKLSIPGFWAGFEPGSVDHGIIQATARDGYLFNLPCPEGNPELYKGEHGKGPRAHRNGGTTTVIVTAQRWYAGRLVLVIDCAGCSRSIRLPELKDAAPILDMLERLGKSERQQADCWFGGRDTSEQVREEVRANMRKQGDYWDEVARRITAGYAV
jgi:hypothetical protein